MKCLTCDHPKSSHIYEEGSCRPGFACPCEKYVPNLDDVDEMLNYGNSLKEYLETAPPVTEDSVKAHVSKVTGIPLEDIQVKTTGPREVLVTIPRKEIDPDVAEILGRLITETGLQGGEDRGTFEGDYNLIRDVILNLRNDLQRSIRMIDGFLLHEDGWTEKIRKRWSL